ncbi:hypothetical protein C8Q79DRAFT_929756 [Trametes meyenii]|nr:hypothetical protein C8Q79DRAFT_929756 [Trametes meyenii]
MDSYSNSTDGPVSPIAGPLEEVKAEVGALLVGTFLGLALYGMSIHQARAALNAKLEGLGYSTLNVFARSFPSQAVIFCFTECVFSRRVSLLWPKYGLMIAITAGIFTVVQFGSVIVSCVSTEVKILIPVFLRYMPQTTTIVQRIRWLGAAHSVGVMVASELLAGALIHRLRSSRTGFKR